MERECYEITKVKVLKDKLSCSYAVKVGDIIFNGSKEASVDATPALLEAIKPFSKYLAVVLHQDPKKDKVFMAEHIVASGISKSTVKNHECVTITGKFKTAGGKFVAINSEPIPYDGEVYDFEDLETDVKLLCNAAYDYFFSDKEGEQEELKFN